MRVKWSDTGDGGLGTKTHETCHDDQSLENEEEKLSFGGQEI